MGGVYYSQDGMTLIGADRDEFRCGHYKIRDGVRHIGANAFLELLSLKSLWMPDSVEDEDGSLCEGCRNLVRARLSAGIRHPNIAMFSGCESLETVELQDGLEGIGENMFAGCLSLRHIRIPSTVWYFLNDTFCGSGLEDIELPEGLKRIGYDTFVNCRALRHLTIPPNVEEIGPWLLQGHKDFDGVECLSPLFRIEDKCLISNKENELLACWSKNKVLRIPTSVKVIGSICNDLVETVVIPSHEVKIGNGLFDAFDNCPNLKEIKYDGLI